jgi:hypothetical protein
MLDPRDSGSEPRDVSDWGFGNRGLAARRLRELATPRLEGGEELLAWTRVWVSRDGKVAGVLAARTRDFAVLTNHRLMLWSIGFFTRRPRRRVLTDRLTDLTVDDIGRVPYRCLRVRAFARRALRFEFGRRPPAHAFAVQLVTLVANMNAGPVAKFGEPPFEQGNPQWRP